MRFSSFLLTGWFIGWFIGPAAAQPPSMKVPGLGFAWDERSNQIRPIHGIAGAAALGDSAVSASTGKAGYASAVISPRHDLAFAVSATDGKVQAIRLSSGEVRDIPGLAPAPTRLIFSPSGTAALAVGPKLQLLTGLPDSLTVQDLGIPPDSGAPTAIAVSDDAQLVLFSAGSGDTASTWLLAPGTSPFQLVLPGPIAIAAFRPGSRDAVALGAEGAVYRILNSTLQQVYPGEERTADPVAVRVSGDGSRVYAANRLGIVAAINLATQSVDAVNCGCAPTGMEPMTASGLFRINEISDRPLMLFDVSTPTPRVWFVPADAPSADSSRSGQ